MNFIVTTWQQAGGAALFFFMAGLGWVAGTWCAGWLTSHVSSK